MSDFNGKVIKGNGVKTIIRKDGNVIVSLDNGEELSFDKLVCATHADQTYKMITDITDEERLILEPWEYSRNRTVLHTDSSFMPPSKTHGPAGITSKNKGSKDEDNVSVTYYMNRLQGLSTNNDYLVTLNPVTEIPKDKIIYETVYTHPKYTQQSLATQKNINDVSGKKTYSFVEVTVDTDSTRTQYFLL